MSQKRFAYHVIDFVHSQNANSFQISLTSSRAITFVVAHSNPRKYFTCWVSLKFLFLRCQAVIMDNCWPVPFELRLKFNAYILYNIMSHNTLIYNMRCMKSYIPYKLILEKTICHKPHHYHQNEV